MNKSAKESPSLVFGAETLAKLRAGDSVEVARFLASIRPRLRRMLDHGLNARIRSRLDASDLVQETLVRVAAGLPTYLQNPKVPPAVWVRLVGKQVAAENHRAQFRGKRDPAREVDWDSVCGDLVVNRVADSIHDIWQTASLLEVRGLVREAITQLPTLDREILEMRHVEEYTLTEVAEMLGISSEAAKKRYQRALKRFRGFADQIERKGEAPTP